MRLTYETAVATLIQFILLSFLNIVNGIDSTVSSCRTDGGDCATNVIVSLVFYILIAAWFGGVWLLGSAAQEQRSKRLAQLLIAAELMVAAVAYFNIKHRNPGDYLSLVISVIDLILAIWVITLAIRLIRAKGGRVVNKQRGRQRRHTIS
jgi:uncharacterized membrane protein HdeD (DUF308 family)